MSVLAQLSRELAALVARAAPAVVGLSHRQGQGSGHNSDGNHDGPDDAPAQSHGQGHAKGNDG